jgi:ubiquinone/menaquinone biosynthesis C-methylase UbiE
VDSDHEIGSREHMEMMNLAYGEAMLKVNDIVGRNDFYGVIGERGVRFLAERLKLTPDSQVLDLCSGIGGPARFLAREYGCRVTGIELSDFNHGVAEERTKNAGLDHLVDYLHGNALEIPYADDSFTDVISCDAWTQFPDKVRIYEAAYRVLKPGGRIAFLEYAHKAPGRYGFEKLFGRNYLVTMEEYSPMLEASGFDSIEQHDTTELVCRDMLSTLHRAFIKKDEIKESLGLEFFMTAIEFWIEYLTLFSERILTHCCFIARKNSNSYG